jgi:electron transport complex protein RnfB
MDSETRLLALLPGTQCVQCGHAGCAPYAAALTTRTAEPDACPPGGAATRAALSAALGLDFTPSLEDALAPFPPALVAVVHEETCIGCAKCLPACPVDALIGAPRFLHQVLTEACTGCGLCLPPCPVDCIELVPTPPNPFAAASAEAVARIKAAPGTPCTRCGACEPQCPEGLDPRALHERLRDLSSLAALGPVLERCTLCGACDTVCPSAIPLSSWFQHGRLVALEAARRELAAERATSSSDRRKARLAAPAPRAGGFPELADLTPEVARRELAGLLRNTAGQQP